MLVEKTISRSLFENEQRDKSSGGTWVARLPLWLMRRIVLRNLESFRRPKDIVMPILPVNDVTHTQHEIDGKPNKVRINVFGHQRGADKPRPLLFFIHGGGFLGGDSLMNEGLMRHLADKLDILCASVDYNVAPEAKHPAAINDCARALAFVLDNCLVNKNMVFLAGDSAGGNLAAALTLKLLDEKALTPKGQILFYPVTDLDSVGLPSYHEKGIEYSAMRRGIKLSQSLYLPDKASRKHPYVSPMCADFKFPQPDALLLIAERDGLRSDGLAYAEKLEKAGGYARCVLYKGAFHSFINDLFRSDIADDAAAEMLTFIKDRISEVQNG